MDLTVIPTAQLTVLEFSSNGNKGFQHPASTRVVCIHPDMTYSVQDRHSVSMVDSFAKLQERSIDRSDQTKGHCFPRKINNGVDPFVVSLGALDKLVKKRGAEKTYYTSTLKVSDHIRDTESEFHRQVNELIFSKSADRKSHIENYSLQSTHDGSIYRLLTDEGALSSNCSIPAGVPIGVMGGWLMTEQEYEVSCDGLNTMDEVRDDYAIAVSGAKGLVWDAYFDSSQMSLINDGSLRSDSGILDKERVNVEFVIYYCPIMHNQTEMHYPVLVVVTKKEINEGDELWVSYGKDFWSLRRQRQKEKFEKLKQTKALEQSSRIDNLFPMDHLHIDKILEDRVNRLLLFKDIAAALNPPLTEGTVACRFHKAMTYMISAVDEAREDCTDDESIVNSSEVQDVAELLGIKPEKVMELVNAYQGGPSRRNLFLIIDLVKCGHAKDIGELKRLTGIRKLVIRKKMSEMFTAHYEGGVTSLARHCKLPVHQAEDLLQVFPKIQQVISTEPKSYMESLEESVRSQLVEITNWRLKNTLPIRNKRVEKKVNQYNWPVQLHSVYNYLGNIESLIMSTLGHIFSPEYDLDTSEASYDSLITIGFDSEQLCQCQKWLQEGDQLKCYVDARKFMNYISGEPFKDKKTAIRRFKKQVPEGKETEFYHRVLREFKQRQRSDATGLSNARYFHVKQGVITEWLSVVEGFDKTVKSSDTTEKPSCSSGGGALTGNNRRFPSGQKKLDKPAELEIKRDMIRELCKEGQGHPSKEGVNEIIRLRYNSEYQDVTYRMIKEKWMKEWYRVASDNNTDCIVECYQFTKKEAAQLLEIFRQRPQSGVSTVRKIEAKKKFIDLYLDSGGRRSFAIAREKFNESYNGYTYRELLRWQNEWKQHCSDSVSDLQTRYHADGNDIKRWKSVWERSIKSNYSQLTPGLLMEYFDVVFSTASRELKVSEFDKRFAVKHNVCAGTLQQKRLDLRRKVKDGGSCDELSIQFGLDKQAIAKWVKVINMDYEAADLEIGSLQRKLFTALWSDALVKNRSEVVAEIFDSEFRLGKAHKWCNAFTKMLLSEKNDEHIQRKYDLNQDQIDLFRKNVKKQQLRIESGESVPKRNPVKRKDCHSVEHPVRKKKKQPSTIARTETASGSDTHCHTNIKIEPMAIEDKPQTAVQPVKKERVPVFELFRDFSFPVVVGPAEEPLCVNKIELGDGCATGSDTESLSPPIVKQNYPLISPSPVIKTPEDSSEMMKLLPETDVGINFSELLDMQLFKTVCSFETLFEKGNDFHIDKKFIFAGFKLCTNGFQELSQSDREQQQRDIIARFVTNSVHGKSKFQAQGYSKIWNNVTAYDEFFKNTGVYHMQNGSEAYLHFLINDICNEQDHDFSPLRWLKEVLLINSHLHEVDDLARLMIFWVECTHLMAFQHLKIQPSVFDWKIFSRTLSTQDISEFGTSGFISISDYEMPLQRPKRKRASEKVKYYPELL